MIKKYFRMFFVFSFSCVILLMFLTVSGILQVQGAVDGPEEAMIEKRQSGMQAPLQDADIGVIKLDDPDPVIAGNPLTYTLVVTNYGPSPAINVRLVDDYPQQKLDYIGVTPEPDCGRQGHELVCAFGDLAVGESKVVTLFMGVKAAAANPLNNPVSVTTDSTDPNPANNQDTENTTIIYSSDMSVTTFDDPDPVDPGGTLNYTLTIHNGGPSQATSVLVNDTLPAELNLVSITPTQGTCNGTSCSLGTIAPGANAYVNIVTTVALGASGIITNTAQVSGQEADPVPGNNTDYETTAIGAGADLLITKDSSPDPVSAGGLLTYTLTANNLGPSEATDVLLVDSLPVGVTFISSTPGSPTCSNISGSVTCSLGSLSSGTTTEVTIVVLVDQAAIGPLINEADISTTTYDPSLINNHAIESTAVIYSSDLIVTTVDDPDPTDPGETLTYILTIDNTGPSNASGVVVTDTMPAEVSLVSIMPSQGSCAGTVCTLGTMLAGATANVTLVTTVDLSATGLITNTAQVSSDDIDPDTSNNVDLEFTTVGLGADLSITKSDYPDPVAPGGLLTYTISVVNNGPDAAPNITLVDNLPPEVTFVSSLPGAPICTESSGVVTCGSWTLAPSESTAVNIIVQVDPSIAFPFVNQAEVSSPEYDPDTSNNQVSEPTSLLDAADLSVSTIDNPDPVMPGDWLTYVLTVVNNGPHDATGVVLTDTLPSDVALQLADPSQGSCTGTVCDLGMIQAGNSAQVTLLTLVDINASGVITNSAQVVSDIIDPFPDNNLDLEFTTVGEGADLALTKTASPDPVVAGENLTYDLTIHNLGPSSASNVTLIDNLPADVSFLSVTPGPPTCLHTAGSVTCNLGAIAADETVAVTILVHVDSSALGVLTNQASVSSITFDPDTANNETGIDTDVVRSSDLAIDLTDEPDPVGGGEILTYTLTVQNSGPSDARDVLVVDTLPAEVTLLSTDPSQGSCNGTSCQLGDLGAGGNASVVIRTFVDVTQPMVITNTVEVSSLEPDPQTGNNVALETTTVSAGANLSLVKEGLPDPVIAGEMLIYTLTINNIGPLDAENVMLVDALPSQVTFVSSSPGEPTCSYSDGSVDCALGNLLRDESILVEITVGVDPSAMEALTNQASVSSPTFDPDQADNQAQVTTQLETAADLALDITDNPDPVPPGSELIYTIDLDNNGPSVSRDVELTVQLPGQTTLLSVTPGAPTCSQDQDIVTCALSQLLDESGIAVSLDMLLNSDASGSLTLQASLSSGTADPDETNNSASEVTTISIPDSVPPTVEWVSPVGDEQRYDVGSEIVSLEVNANDNVGIQRVDFFWWDPVIAQFIDIGSVYSAPYRIDFDTSDLYFGYNQVYVRAYDTSGNASNRPRILLYRQELQYLPLVTR